MKIVRIIKREGLLGVRIGPDKSVRQTVPAALLAAPMHAVGLGYSLCWSAIPYREASSGDDERKRLT